MGSTGCVDGFPLQALRYRLPESAPGFPVPPKIQLVADYLSASTGRFMTMAWSFFMVSM